MAVRDRLIPWTTQPQEGVRLREGPWSSNSIIWSGSAPHSDLGTRAASPVLNGSNVFAVGSDGLEVAHSSTSGADSLVWTAPEDAVLGFSAVIRFKLDTSSQTTLFNSLNEATTNGAVQIRTSSTNLQFVLRGSSVRLTSSGVPMVVGKWHTVAFRAGVFPRSVTGRPSARMWIDGQLVGTYDSGSTTALVLGDFAVAGGNSLSDATQSRAHSVSLAAFAFDSATDEDLQRASADPWGTLFDDRRIWVPVSAGGAGASVAVPAASLTLTGNSPTVAVSANQTVAVPAGSLSLASYAPTVAVSDHKIVAVPAAELSVTGYAPTVSVGDAQTVSVPAANLALAAHAPTVTASDHKTVAVPAAALSLQAYAPTVVSDGSQVVQVPRAQLALQAYAPTVSAAAPALVAVPAASLQVNAYAPSVVTPLTVAVPAASLALAGYAPVVQVGGGVQIEVPPASLSLVAYAPVVAGDASVVVVPGVRGRMVRAESYRRIRNAGPSRARRI